jgi:3-oxoacid CoA-transferase subunit B
MLGFGPFPIDGEEDPDLINAGKQTITELPGGSYFSSADSFAMIRSGAVDMSILGAFQVSAQGDLANWMVPGVRVKGMGGAMDLVTGTKRTIVMMEHLTKNGEKKIVQDCSYPLTGLGVVNLIVTDMAVIEVSPSGLVLKEIAPDLTISEVQTATSAPLLVASNLHPVIFNKQNQRGNDKAKALNS